MKNLKWYELNVNESTLNICLLSEMENIRKGCTIDKELIGHEYPRNMRLTRASSKANAREYFRQVCDALCATGFVIGGKFVIIERTEYSEIKR